MQFLKRFKELFSKCGEKQGTATQRLHFFPCHDSVCLSCVLYQGNSTGKPISVCANFPKWFPAEEKLTMSQNHGLHASFLC